MTQPTHQSLDLSVCLPSYAEADNLQILLPKIKSTLDLLGCSYEILVIDTCAPLDNTPEICASQGEHVRHILRRGGNFYGHAVMTGIVEARGERTIFMDADGSHDPKFIANLWAVRDKAPIIIASRYVAGGSTDNSKIMVAMSKVVNLAYSIILGLSIADVSNSFKLYVTDDLKGLKLYCSNLDIIEEILYKIVKLKGRGAVLEIPFHFETRLHGKSKRKMFSFVCSYFLTLLKLRLGIIK